ncbi:Os11g0695600 [Oryza sativa Japonica Group]|uniref:Os11g0695600 protein n=1 Tax=Oryza sativa subsp. japonica TaxID=39947 RepID=C7J8K0_ORYSJ|nr:Os11g0695600 [Oryza sativa Japonica Group]|eukprot:NP_001176729.1 Os11g0695600 [Oryza sativa Japonica Group]
MGVGPHCTTSLLIILAVVITSSLLTTTIKADEPSNDTDIAALLAFKAQFSDPLGFLRDGWREDNASCFCQWIGVSCSRRRQRVTALELPGIPLQGSITPHLGNLSFLYVLNLANTSLTGTLPGVIGRLHRLELLDLGYNALSGNIPATIGNLTKLELLNLEFNQLSGPIPAELQGLRSLGSMNLRRNYLSGLIPNSLFNNTPLLGYLSIGNNSLSGPIPHVIFSLHVLQVLVLEHNQLSGSLPPAIFNMSRLEKLYATRNNLTGPIPYPAENQTLMNIPMIRVMCLSFNGFIGRIPPGLAACRKLQMLELGGNLLTDHVPEWLAGLSLLSTLVIGQNELVGSIPVVLSNLTKLTVLDLSSCKLSGIIPLELGKMTQLNILHLSFNRLTGPFPTSLGNLTKLSFLGLESNLLTGQVPETLGNLRSLYSLGIGKNHLQGKLHFFALLSNCRELQFLDIGMNSFSGSISASLLANLSNNLQYFYANDNNLTGSIPATISNLSNLNVIGLFDNQISGTIPDSIMLMDNLQALDLSINNLFGPIPGQIGTPKGMVALSLSGNNLSSYIPNGGIPKYFSNLTYLTSLNLSFNNLQGQIPSGGIFSNITMQSLMGNAGLCGAPRLGFPACLEKSDSTRTKHLLKIVLPTVIVAFGAIVVFLYLMIAKKMKNPDITASFGIADAICHRLVSYQEIVRATENFNEDNLLGVGSFGKVFKGRLDDGLVVAIKILNMQVERAIRSFDAECHVLRMARHRNLIKILNTCSNLDFRALFLQFMPNGNLESYLHSESRPCVGSFLKRMEIMLDVSMAMEYLHHEHHEVVLHCDLKPSNVLFDEEMTAHVADFGIAKMLLGDDNSAVSASMLGTIGYMAPVFELGLLCSADSPEQRTAMSDVVVTLKKIRKDYVKLMATTRPGKKLMATTANRTSKGPQDNRVFREHIFRLSCTQKRSDSQMRAGTITGSHLSKTNEAVGQRRKKVVGTGDNSRPALHELQGEKAYKIGIFNF